MRLHLPVLALSLLTAGACSSREVARHEPGPATDSVVTVNEELIPVYAKFHGTVQARRRAEISTRMTGRIDSVFVDIGEHVTAGQLLAALGTVDVELQEQKARAGFALTEASYREALRTAARMDTLFEQDAVPRVRRDRAHLQLTAAETRLAVSRAELREIQNARSYSAIRAPWSGTVVDRRADPGDLALPGVPIVVLDDEAGRDVEVFVPVAVAGGLSVGSSVTVIYNERNYPSMIRRIAGAADVGAHLVKVLATAPPEWIPGTSVTVAITTGIHTAVVLDGRFVIRQGQLTGVRIRTPYGQILRWIRLGPTVPDSSGTTRYEVLAGLRPGDEVVVP